MASAAAAVIGPSVAWSLRAIPRRLRVLIVDAHQLIQEGLAAMIDREEDMTVVATASTAAEALSDVRRYRPDIVTLDFLLPDMPGEELARRILAEFPQTRIVAITSAHGHMQARRALDAGVHAYLPKAVSADEIIGAIRQVQAGERIVPGPMASGGTSHDFGSALTSREIEILQLIAWGTGYKQVAAQLMIAGETVRMHVRRILAKLGANDRTHAVTIAVARGLLRVESA